jgi:hypothetical protein
MPTVLKEIPIEEWFAIVESANAPMKLADESKWWTEVAFPAKDGWVVTFFYDSEDLDYIHSITTPEGQELDFWTWPEHNPLKNALINWRSPDDTQRLIEAIKQELKTPFKYREEDPNYGTRNNG